MLTSFVLNPRFDYWLDPPLHHPGEDFTGEAEECDASIIRVRLTDAEPSGCLVCIV